MHPPTVELQALDFKDYQRQTKLAASPETYLQRYIAATLRHDRLYQAVQQLLYGKPHTQPQAWEELKGMVSDKPMPLITNRV